MPLVSSVLLELPNAGPQARLEAGARHERTLEGVACRPMLGEGLVTDSAAVPPVPTVERVCPCHRPVALVCLELSEQAVVFGM